MRRRRIVRARSFRALCQARELIDACYAEPLGLETLAQAAGLSRYHFLREFAELFGCTPHQYLIGVRIARAKELLARPGATVTDTCFEVGFSSLGSFSSLFARRTGRSPIAYHREIAPLVQVPGGVARVYVPHCFLAHFAV